MTTTNRLYDLMPLVYRQRDAPHHELEQFFRALQVGFDQAVESTERLYANLFIATCDDECLPYIAALVGISHHSEHALSTNRLAIANALAARQRKGTLAAVEMVCHDVTGWRVVARDMGRQLGITQNMEQVEPDRGLYVDIADEDDLEQIGGPDDDIARRPSVAPGAEFGPATVALFVYAHDWYPLDGAQLRQRGEGEYWFSPFGIDLPVRLDSGEAPDDAAPPPEVMGVPSVERSPTAVQPVVGRIHIDGRDADLPLGDIVQFDLGTDDGDDRWPRPPGPSPAAYVDLERGRLTLAPGVTPAKNTRVFADFYYRFGADIGGGPYRPAPIEPADGRHIGHRLVSRRWFDTLGDEHAGSAPLPDLVAALAPPRDPATTITIDDNARYVFDTLEIEIDRHCHLTIQAGPGVRPTLQGDIVVTGRRGAGFSLGGLCLAGRVIRKGDVDIDVHDCTIWSPSPEPSIDTGSTGAVGQIELKRSILGQIAAEGSRVTVADCIVGRDPSSGSAARSDRAVVCELLETQRSSFMGPVRTTTLKAESSLFVGEVDVDNAAGSNASHSYFAANRDVRWPVTGMPLAGGGGVDLISRTFGDTRYAQIAWSERPVLLAGGQHGSEVGAYNMARRASKRQALRDQAGGFVPPGFDIDVRVLEQGPSTDRSSAS